MTIKQWLRVHAFCSMSLVFALQPVSAEEPARSAETTPVAPRAASAPREKIDQLPQAGEPVDPLEIAQALPLPAQMGVIGGSEQAPDYWVVSTRNCAQVSNGNPCCHYDIFRMLPDRKLHRYDLQSFLNALVLDVPLCMYCHGSFVDWNDFFQDSWNTYHWWRRAAPERPAQFVFFTWPSDMDWAFCPLLDLKMISRQSTLNGIYLAQLFKQISPRIPLGLVGHSMGTQTISVALHLMAGGALGDYCLGNFHQDRRIRAVFVAAAIEHDWLNPDERYGRALYSVECLLVMKNPCDLALFFYPLRRLAASRSLAFSGFTHRDRMILGPLAAKTREYDVSPMIGRHHYWHHYYEIPWLAKVMVPYLYF